MKILLVHNDYGKYSGEEAVIDKMTVMLGGFGHEVCQLRRSTKDARENIGGKVKGFVSGIYCPSGVKAMREAIMRERPDVVNVHNLYPFISPAALRECRKAGVPVVMTVHNFRLICPTGLFMRNGAPCELCLTKGNEWNCIRHNCEHSLMKSIGYAARNTVARLCKYYMNCVDCFACITAFQRKKLIEAGFPAEKIIVIPNSIDLLKQETITDGNYVAFSGRISQEKGVDLIIDVAKKHPEIKFKLAGAVRDSEIVENLPGNVELAGYLSGRALEEFYNNASFFVMASRWYEGFPMSILEAARYGKPMIGPDHGGFPEIIGHGADSIGRLFVPDSAESLERQITELWAQPEEVRILGLRAYEKLRREYSTDVIGKRWLRLFENLCL